jgi:hypothetical protein
VAVAAAHDAAGPAFGSALQTGQHQSHHHSWSLSVRYSLTVDPQLVHAPLAAALAAHTGNR